MSNVWENKIAVWVDPQSARKGGESVIWLEAGTWVKAHQDTQVRSGEWSGLELPAHGTTLVKTLWGVPLPTSEIPDSQHKELHGWSLPSQEPLFSLALLGIFSSLHGQCRVKPLYMHSCPDPMPAPLEAAAEVARLS